MTIIESPGLDICVRLEQRPFIRWSVYSLEDFERLRLYLDSHPELKELTDHGARLVGLDDDRNLVNRLGVTT